MPKCELTSQSEPATFVLIPGGQIKSALLQLRYIQTLLVHHGIRTIEIYTHVAHHVLSGIENPLNS